MTHQIHTGRVGTPGKTLGDEEVLAQRGLDPDEFQMARPPEIHFQEYGEWIVSSVAPGMTRQTSVPLRFSVTNGTYTASTGRIVKSGAFASYVWHSGDTWVPNTTDGGFTVGATHAITSKVDDDTIVITGGPVSDSSIVDGTAGFAVDVTANTLTLHGHRFFSGERVKFTGITSTGLSTTDQYFVEVVSKDTFKVHTGRALSAATDITGQPTATLNVVRFNYFYQDVTQGIEEIYTPLGVPIDATHRFPDEFRFNSGGPQIPPMALAGGGRMRITLTGTVLNDTGGNRNVMLVVDPDPNARADGYLNDLGIATVTGATTLNISMTAHGLLMGDRILLFVATSGGAVPAGLAVNTIYYVGGAAIGTGTADAADADPTLADTIDFGAAHGLTDGNAVRVYDAGSGLHGLSNTTRYYAREVERLAAISNATYTNATKRITKTGAFTSYTFRAGDAWQATSNDGGFTSGTEYPIASRIDNDTIELVTALGADGANIDGRIVDEQSIWLYPDSSLTGAIVDITSDGTIGVRRDAPQADSFSVFTSIAATAPVSITGNGSAVVQRLPFGSKYAQRFAAQIPGTIVRRTAAKWVVDVTQVPGQLAASTALENALWESVLEIGQNGYLVEPATAGGASRYVWSFTHTRPSFASSAETLRFDWGPRSRAWYFQAAETSFTIAAGETITGSLSGAIATVVEHNKRRGTIDYRQPTVPGKDFMAGEVVTRSGGALETITIGQCERGPIPTTIGLRMAASGADVSPLAIEFIVSHILVEVWRKEGI